MCKKKKERDRERRERRDVGRKEGWREEWTEEGERQRDNSKSCELISVAFTFDIDLNHNLEPDYELFRISRSSIAFPYDEIMCVDSRCWDKKGTINVCE